jgi:predicted CoA-binding protein
MPPSVDWQDPDVIRPLLTAPATWAVVGLSTNTSRTAFGIAGFLRNRLGMSIVPVHPRAETVFDMPGYARLDDIPSPAAPGSSERSPWQVHDGGAPEPVATAPSSVRATSLPIASSPAPIAVVDCFVNSSLVGAVVDEAIAEAPRLGIQAVWLQLGVVDEAAAMRAREAGLAVVMDTCPAIQAAILDI